MHSTTLPQFGLGHMTCRLGKTELSRTKTQKIAAFSTSVLLGKAIAEETTPTLRRANTRVRPAIPSQTSKDA